MQEETKEQSSREWAVEARALTRVFRDFWGRPRVRAVRDLDLQVEGGEVFGLLGPNGSGKSTTMKLVLGLLRPTSGYVRILEGSPRDVRLKSRVGYLPEDSHFYPHLTAEETLEFYGSMFSISRSELQRRTEELLQRVGLREARKRRVGDFSKGMQRRIGLAQALINDPELLILDEPTAGMDPMGTREVKDLILSLKARGKTVLLSSHLLADVEDVCDRVAILHRGRLRALGAIQDLLADDQRTQIVTDKLSPETLQELTALLRQNEGEDLQVAVGRPSTRLEDFFIRVVGGEEPGHSEGTKDA